jgi:hypothetical protein
MIQLYDRDAKVITAILDLFINLKQGGWAVRDRRR